jgi:hypothetical protein
MVEILITIAIIILVMLVVDYFAYQHTHFYK